MASTRCRTLVHDLTEPAVRAKTHVALRRRSAWRGDESTVRRALPRWDPYPCPCIIRLRVDRSTRPKHAHVHTSSDRVHATH
eukprot:scaffold21352_cov48-Phaeocystis_antarctica.AAC.5